MHALPFNHYIHCMFRDRDEFEFFHLKPNSLSAVNPVRELFPSWSCFLFCFIVGIVCEGQRDGFTLSSCLTAEPIPNAYVLYENSGKLLGISNRKGYVEFLHEPVAFPIALRIYKMSSLDTLATLVQAQKTLCLTVKSYSLKEFEVISETPKLAEIFEEYIEKTVKVLNVSDSTHFFDYNYVVAVPDSGWKLEMTGVLKISIRGYDKGLALGYGNQYCQMKARMDSAFYTYARQNEINFLDIIPYLSGYDSMQKRLAYRKDIKEEMVLNKSQTGESTLFTFSNIVYRKSKNMISYPTFNADSILMSDEIELVRIEEAKSEKFMRSIPLNERAVLTYCFQPEGLVMSSTVVSETGKFNSEITCTRRFEAVLIDEVIDPCSGLSIYEASKDFTLERMANFELIEFKLK